MSTQIDRGHSAQRPMHLNVATPLSARTLEAIQCEITKEMIAIIATHARAVIPCTPAAPANTVVTSDSTQPTSYQSSRSGACERLPSPPTTPGSSALSSIPPLDMFITNLVLRSRVQAGTLICTLVYLRRLRRRLPKEARGMECTCHRIFLATLIVAGKYLNDASPKNKYWARYSTVFTVAETPAGPVHQITADDMVPLRPSPKKRAVSRGHYGNIPHPSPVYHCATVGTQSSAATTAAASALTASSACFLQPLEQASIAYASSRYQQQRYDPHISRGAKGETPSQGLPRMTMSIPSFRGPGSANSSSTQSPAGNPSSSSRSNAKQAERCTLRHQSTLPDFSQLSKGAQPTQPPVARLASGSSYAADSSPVHTLVYGGCSPGAVVAGNARHQAGNATYSRQQTCSTSNSDNKSSAPAYALTSLSVDAQGLTLSEATSSSSSDSKRLIGEAAPIAIYADVSRPTHDNGLQTEYVQAAASGTGWHLKSRILHPLRGWFGSSRQNQHNGNHIPPAPSSAMPDPAQPSSASCARDEHTHVNAAALRNRHVATHSMSPTFLDPLAPQTASVPVLARTGTCAAPH
ncbi:PHO85 cyclin-1 [Coemansia pectinata]|uniref:PHO85 cyclin-1 n=1 Tax=Coemansia pectinata TaxID=1052879 RepID=A0A9W8LCS4_9FUNG|nr:PHO85 cyclin-1 [Coemansia pectinata]